MEQKVYKRKTREMSDATKQKISQSLKGRKKSVSHCQSISKGLKAMWSTIGPKKETSTDTAPNNGF